MSADYARKGNKVAQDFELEQTFGWDDLKKGLKKAAKIGKDVINTGKEVAKVVTPMAQEAAKILKEEDPATYEKLEDKYTKAKGKAQHYLSKGTDYYNRAAPALEKAAESAKQIAPEYASDIDSGLNYYGQGSQYLDRANDYAAHYGLIDLDELSDDELLELFSFKKAWNSVKKGAKKATKIASDAGHIALNIAEKAAPIAKEFAPEYADDIDQGLSYTRKGSMYADKANSYRDYYALNELSDQDLQNLKFSFKKMGRSMSRGFKKATPYMKKGLHVAASGAKLAAPIASTVAP